MERASWNIKNGTSMAGSFVGQRGPREQMRIGGCKKGDREERRDMRGGGGKGAVQESETQYLFTFPPPLFSMRRFHREIRRLRCSVSRSIRIDFNAIDSRFCKSSNLKNSNLFNSPFINNNLE